MNNAKGALLLASLFALVLVQSVNAVPFAANVSISPLFPIGSDNLIGSYNLTNATNATNISSVAWYKNNVLISGANTTTLSAGNTSAGDVFNFEVTPIIICLQGDFNTTTNCGTNASNTSVDFFHTTSAVSFGSSGGDGASTQVNAIVNYTKPTGVLNSSTLYAKIGQNTTGAAGVGSLLERNFTLSSTCWNAYADKVRIGVRLGRSFTQSPFYNDFSELFCYNSTGWERFYLAGTTVTQGCDNPNGVASDMTNAFDNDLSSYVCASSFSTIQKQPSASYFGNPACARGASCQFVSAGSLAGLNMNWVIQGSPVNSSQVTIKAPPVASNVSASQSGTLSTDVLVGSYTYTDADNDTENGTTYRWLYASNGTVFNTSRNATIGNIANGVQVIFEVTPRDSYETGTAVNSSAYSVVRKQAPVASNVTVSQTGVNPANFLVGSYSYSDVDNDTENGTTFKWYYVSNNTVFATTQNTTISDIVNGTVVRFEVTPRDAFSNGTAVNSSNYSVLARIPPTAVVQLINSTGGVVTNSSSLSVATNLHFTASSFTHHNLSESGAALYINYLANNSTTVLLNQTVNATALSNSTSNNFQLPNYQAYTYTVTVYDQFNKNTVYSGNLLAGNQQPNITAVETYRGGTPNSCQVDTVCEVRITLSEDGCSLARQSENVVVLTPSSNAIVNDTALIVSLDSLGTCQYKTDSFTPIVEGVYNYSVSFTDYGGLSDTESGSFTVQPTTQPPPSTPSSEPETVVTTVQQPVQQSSAAGGGGAIVEIVYVKQDVNQSFQVAPAVKDVTLRLAGTYDGEFQVVNDGTMPIFVDISVDRVRTSEAVRDWIDFAGVTQVNGLEITPGEGLNSNLKYIRYTIDAKSTIPTGDYKIYLNVRLGNETKQHQINVKVVDSIWAQLEEFWNKEVINLSDACVNNGDSSKCSGIQAIRAKHIIGVLLIVGVGSIAILSARSGRRRDGNN